MKPIYSWLDSDILTHSFSPQKLKIVKYFKWLLKWNIWNWSIIKLYKTLSIDWLKEYHKKHNFIIFFSWLYYIYNYY